MNSPVKKRHIMILTGEPSGDFHAGTLIKAMRKADPDLYISGIGGPCMEAQHAQLFFPIEKLSAMGLTEVIFQFKYIKQAFDEFKFRLRTQKPDLLILLDYPGFNLKAARYAKLKYHIPIFYYITPKVWAWKPSRLKVIKKFVDHAALIFPFEQKLYKKAKIPSTYVGNPLMDDFPEHLTKPFLKRSGLKGSFLNRSTLNGPFTNGLIPKKPGRAKTCLDGPVIGLLPGSRKAEINNLLGIMLETAQKIKTEKKNARFLISAAPGIHEDRIKTIMEPYNQDNIFQVIQGRPLEIFKESDLLIAASGTVTLEAALCCLPTIIIYKMSPISFQIAKILVNVKYAGLANLIAGKEMMPELLQEDANPEKISKKVFSMLKNLRYHENRLFMVRRLLGGPGASKRAARIALDLVKLFVK
jgi:lipid-A-disaccharide synthase